MISISIVMSYFYLPNESTLANENPQRMGKSIHIEWLSIDKIAHLAQNEATVCISLSTKNNKANSQHRKIMHLAHNQ